MCISNENFSAMMMFKYLKNKIIHYSLQLYLFEKIKKLICNRFFFISHIITSEKDNLFFIVDVVDFKIVFHDFNLNARFFMCVSTCDDYLTRFQAINEIHKLKHDLYDNQNE